MQVIFIAINDSIMIVNFDIFREPREPLDSSRNSHNLIKVSLSRSGASIQGNFGFVLICRIIPLRQIRISMSSHLHIEVLKNTTKIKL